MITYFKDYSWKNGKPVGRGVLTGPHTEQPYYKIVADPYYRRISVECYRSGSWHSLVYDSMLLDFRKLNERDQLAWQKEVTATETDRVECLIRDQDDRVICLEKHRLKENIPVECQIFSPHGNLLAIQKMHYTLWGDPFNGVTLSDSTGRLVLKKIYNLDDKTFEFTELLEEIQCEK